MVTVDVDAKYADRMSSLLIRTSRQISAINLRHPKGGRAAVDQTHFVLNAYVVAADRIRGRLTPDEARAVKKSESRAEMRIDAVAGDTFKSLKRAGLEEFPLNADLVTGRVVMDSTFTVNERVYAFIIQRDRFFRGVKYVYDNAPKPRTEQPG